MVLAQENHIAEQPAREELEQLLYRYLTIMELTDPEDLAIARGVLHLDAKAHLNENKEYYRERFAEIRRGG